MSDSTLGNNVIPLLNWQATSGAILTSHPAADIFPLMDDAAFALLKADIQANGQREWIELLDGKILDGRNRYRACIELGIEPETCERDPVEGFDPVAYVLSKNLHRRQLKTSQKAICAAKTAGLQHGGNRSKVSIETLSSAKSADLFGVGRASLFRAHTVLRDGCKGLISLCERGAVSVALGAEFVGLVPDVKEQAKIVSKGKTAIQDAVRKPPDPPSLIHCIERLRSHVDCMLEQWPPNEIAALSAKLRSYAEEIDAGSFRGDETEPVTCPNCGATEFDEDGDCASCHEPGVVKVQVAK